MNWRAMVYTSNIQPSSLTEAEKLLADRVRDMLFAAEDKNSPKYTAFLDERQQLVATWALHGRKSGKAVFFGGFEQAQRKVFAALPYYMDESDTEEFPISALTFTYPIQYTLSHRDFLGALMNLMIKREAIGDILVGEGIAVVFLKNTVASTVVTELQKVGNVGVKGAFGAPDLLPIKQELLEINGTVNSLRADNIVAFLTRTSREQTSSLIKSGLVTVNSAQVTSPSKAFVQGDKIAVRGYGKFVFSQMGNITKKDRIHITCHKYI